jgi:hypothetical protein
MDETHKVEEEADGWWCPRCQDFFEVATYEETHSICGTPALDYKPSDYSEDDVKELVDMLKTMRYYRYDGCACYTLKAEKGQCDFCKCETLLAKFKENENEQEEKERA